MPYVADVEWGRKPRSWLYSDKSICVHSLDREDVRSVNLGAICNIRKGTGLVWFGHQIMGNTGPSKRPACLRTEMAGTHLLLYLIIFFLLYCIVLYCAVLYCIVFYTCAGVVLAIVAASYCRMTESEEWMCVLLALSALSDACIVTCPQLRRITHPCTDISTQ